MTYIYAGLIVIIILLSFRAGIKRWKKGIYIDLKSRYEDLRDFPNSGSRDLLKKYIEFQWDVNEYRVHDIDIGISDFGNLERTVYKKFFQYMTQWHQDHLNLCATLETEKAICKSDTEPEMKSLIAAVNTSEKELDNMKKEAKEFINYHSSIKVNKDGLTPYTGGVGDIN